MVISQIRSDTILRNEDELKVLIQGLMTPYSSRMKVELPDDEDRLFAMYDTLVTLRPPFDERGIDGDWLDLQDDYLKKRLASGNTLQISDLSTLEQAYGAKPRKVELSKKGESLTRFRLCHTDRICLFSGDIIHVACDCLVNDASSTLTGCGTPRCTCTDHLVHIYAGTELKNSCAAVMEREQADNLPAGEVRITRAWNLNAKSIIHAVSPRINGEPSDQDITEIRSAYDASMDLIREKGYANAAFPVLSTSHSDLDFDMGFLVCLEELDQSLDDMPEIERVCICVPPEYMDTAETVVRNFGED